ncbi:hypothetical protein RGB72_08155 [Glutamicibacter protophormiae]|uniref:Uncharacterized protein n=1 Tax=Kocuria varians TaxID=1272 RepID=A0A7D7L2R4_KOCVA|nr:MULTISPECIES: hypothetical protein [Kocuria]MDN5631881.1 hypothetical protein [Kocuria sp.]QMS56464.1 hypothetical protein CIB50_0001169 [Kocuria varians]WNB87968.1 hypothetical protein RGB72_08155 [Glutamicibacter protophormiae]
MDYLAVFLPSLGVGVVFYLVMRWLFRGDRAERSAQTRAQQDAERWYREVREREGDAAPFGHEQEQETQRPQRGLALRNSIPIRESPEDPQRTE